MEQIHVLFNKAMRFSQVTNKLWLKGQLSLNAWHFYSRAKLNVLPVLALSHCFHRGSDLKCRRCHEYDESLSHVLQGCRLNMTMIAERHNKAQGVLKSKNRIIFVDSIYSFVNLNLRIDLMVIDNRLKTIHLVDMKCPRDNLFTLFIFLCFFAFILIFTKLYKKIKNIIKI